jgi:hypothetical protein
VNVLEKFWCQLPEDGKVNSNEICRSRIQDFIHKLHNSAFVVLRYLRSSCSSSPHFNYNDQLHATATLPLQKKPLLPTKQESRWGPICTIWRRDEFLVPVMNQTTIHKRSSLRTSHCTHYAVQAVTTIYVQFPFLFRKTPLPDTADNKGRNLNIILKLLYNKIQLLVQI